MKQVRETAAGKSIAAYVILDPTGKPVATVQAHYGDSRVMVDIWHMEGDTALQQGKAQGYGYDKFTAALSGMVIDGHAMRNHCERGEEGQPGVRPANGGRDHYYDAGLRYLESLGYKVMQAI